MSVAAAPLQLAEAARIMREAVKDRTYQGTPLGQEVKRFLEYFRMEYGATRTSLRDYESILRMLALEFADLGLHDLEAPAGTQLLRDFRERRWGEAAPATRMKVRAVWVSFFDHMVEERRMATNPARPLRTPKRRGVSRGLIATADKQRLIAGQARTRDTLAVRLLFGLALRKSELGAVQFKHFDFARRRLRVFGKGGTVFDMPVPRDLIDDVERYLLGRDPEEFLLYPEKRGRRFLAQPVETIWEDRFKGMSEVALHRWWKACLLRAGVQDYMLHSTRHTAITDFHRACGDLKLTQQFARHLSITSTVIYTHLDDMDLERVMDAVDGGTFNREGDSG